MATYSATGTSSNFDDGAFHARINVTTTDYATYTTVTVVCSAVAKGSGYWSNYIRGRASSTASNTYGNYSDYKSVNTNGAGSVVEMIRHTFNVTRTTSNQVIDY